MEENHGQSPSHCMMPSKDEDLLYSDFSTPVLENYHPSSTFNSHLKQHVNPNCYGKGKRLCEFQPPNIPKSCLYLLHGKGQESENDTLMLQVVQGRARSTARSPGCKQNLASSTNKETRDNSTEEGKKERKKDQDGQVSSGISRSYSPSFPWTLFPPNVVQVDGLPVDFDEDILEDVIGFYSPITDKEVRRGMESLSMRYRLRSQDACDLLETNLNHSDFFGTGNTIICRHLTT